MSGLNEDWRGNSGKAEVISQARIVTRPHTLEWRERERERERERLYIHMYVHSQQDAPE